MSSDLPFRIHEQLRASRYGRRASHAEIQPIYQPKEYPRMERIVLPEPLELAMPLGEALRKRTSVRAEPREVLSLQDIGTLLGNALHARERTTRPYPSGGAKYPIEAYVLGVIGDRKPGAYHYHPLAHALEYLWEAPQETLGNMMQPNSLHEKSSVIVFTGSWNRTATKYGDFGYLLGILEAGHMAQNILLAATAMGLSSFPAAGFDEKVAAEILDIDTYTEQPVYTVVVAKSAFGNAI